METPSPYRLRFEEAKRLQSSLNYNQKIPIEYFEVQFTINDKFVSSAYGERGSRA